MERFELAVIGGGPAGLAAALEARKSGIGRIILFERERELGGILQQCVHSGFGLHLFKEELTGPEYAERFIESVRQSDIVYKTDTTVLEISGKRTVKAVNAADGFMEIGAEALVLATGCRERTREAIGIPGDRPAGIFTAGSAQRYMNLEGYRIGKRVVILGSGDVGLIMARRLTLEGSEVVAVVEAMPAPSGLGRNVIQCLDDFGIPLLLGHTVTSTIGKDRLEGVQLAQVDSRMQPIAGTETLIPCDALLLSVGLIPENELALQAGIAIDEDNCGLAVDERLQTSAEGIFACGNAVSIHSLADYVTIQGRLAGRSAARFILDKYRRTGSDPEHQDGRHIAR
ncbi:NAD(P)/FAD-dependent oxidoreductase [Paenibacillus sp. URB8-2]|uniref:NAD(P)/FAD-dependent oxidoreductase n=1 Tax=Paenibacillus sp. URB8-2 TaxID=2741301 RepID=UPI0015BF029F|nr:NAD(P)/FAD-dependent oxidoreductase [Paenibacillus sp. URB8-2]BCG57273.1 pyridine nucleotide-disulfide oxidoreductase [Paenibacillus sp. URB8-2]